MNAVGIVSEYNPFHRGHALHIAATKAALGLPVVAMMSGNFVQRGDVALLPKHARAAAAVHGGADLVLELPAAQSLLSAEGFARAAVGALAATGVVGTISYGSECGKTAPLRRIAQIVQGEGFDEALRAELRAGISFAAARQRAVERLADAETAALLAEPNNLLGVEYEKVCLSLHLRSFTIGRIGAAHDGAARGGIASASHIRALVAAGEDAAPYLTDDSAALLHRETVKGCAPASVALAERAILARLRLMLPEEFARYDEGGEGLYRRFATAATEVGSTQELLLRVKTRRYALSRLRRMLLRMYLGMEGQEPYVPYLRVLACNETGRALLREMKSRATLPLITKPAQARALTAAAGEAFARECRCTDLYALACPDPAALAGGSDWRSGPIIL